MCVGGGGVEVGVEHFNQRYQLPRQAEHEKDAESVSVSVMQPGEPARQASLGKEYATGWQMSLPLPLLLLLLLLLLVVLLIAVVILAADCCCFCFCFCLCCLLQTVYQILHNTCRLPVGHKMVQTHAHTPVCRWQHMCVCVCACV